MESVQIFVENALDRLRSPPPALSGMELGPGDRVENPLMVSRASFA